MRGTVLGFADDKGVIVTEEDRRFAFTSINWRDEQAPLRGAVVDFVEKDGTADDIYLALGSKQPRPVATGDGTGAAPSVREELDSFIGGAGENEIVRTVVDKVKNYPQVVLAALILFAFIFMTYASLGSDRGGMGELGLGEREHVSLFGFNDALSPLRISTTAAADQVEVRIDSIRSGPGPMTGFTATELREAERTRSAVSSLSLTLSLAYLFWLVPICAIGVILLHWKGRPGLAGVASIALGVLCLFAGLYLWLLESRVLGVLPEEGRTGLRRVISRAFELGSGGWLIALCGLGCIVLVFVRRKRGADSA